MAHLNTAALTMQLFHFNAFGNGGVKSAVVAGVTAAQNDVIHVMRVPAGVRLLDIKATISASGASTTAKIGYLPVDGSAGDDDYFVTAGSTAAAAVHRMTAANAPVITDREVDIVITPTYSTGFTASDISVVLFYEAVGN